MREICAALEEVALMFWALVEDVDLLPDDVINLTWKVLLQRPESVD